MKKLKRVIVRGAILGILIFASTLTSLAAVNSQAEWDTYLADQCGTGYNVECLLGFSNGYDDSQHRLAWHGHYWLRAFVSMAQTYQDSKYLDYAVRMIDYMLYYRDDARAARGELDVLQEPYRKAPPFYLNNRDLAAPCWRHNRDCKTVLDGQITSGIMHFVRLVLESRSFGAYETTANDYLVSVLETLSIWDETYVYLPTDYNGGATGSYFWARPDGTGLYTTGSVPYNQSATLLRTALLVDQVMGTIYYRDMIQGLINFWKLYQLQLENGSCIWDYSLLKPELQGIEDTNHGHVDVGFLFLAYELGFALPVEDMFCISRTFTENVYRTNGLLHDQIDGTTEGGSTTDPHAAAGVDWILYQEFDPLILDIAIEVYDTNFPSATWSKPFLGWAEILRLTADANPGNDPPGITVTPTTGLLTTEAGGTDTFTVVLDALPIANVTIDLSPSNPAEGTVSPTSLTFTSGNGTTPQTVTVTGVNDAVVDGDITYTIVTDPAISSDPNYNGLDPADVSVTNNDDDTPSGTPIDMYVRSINIALSQKGRNWEGRATITVVDESGTVVQDVTVTGDWDLNGTDFNSGANATTNGRGQARINSGKVTASSGDVLTFTVTGVSRVGFAWDNTVGEQSATATVP